MPWHEKITDAFGFCSAFCFICAFKMCAYGANRVVLWTISCLIFVLKRRFVIAENSSVRQELESWMVLFKNGRLGVMRWVWVVPVLCGRWCVLGKAWRMWKTSLVCCAFKRFLESKQALFGLQTSLLWRVRASFLTKKDVLYDGKPSFWPLSFSVLRVCFVKCFYHESAVLVWYLSVCHLSFFP